MRLPRLFILLAGLGLAWGLAGCSAWNQWLDQVQRVQSLIPFSYDTRTQFQLTDVEMLGLQYYVSTPIVLRREIGLEQGKVARGALTGNANQVTEEIVIRQGTPGVAVAIGENWLEISFEAGTSLRFGSDPERRDAWHGRYSLLATTWENGIGMVPFNGRIYSAHGDSGNTYLLIDKNFLYESIYNRKVLPGRRL
jgi:hypothetical protein